MNHKKKHKMKVTVVVNVKKGDYILSLLSSRRELYCRLHLNEMDRDHPWETIVRIAPK